MKFEEYRITSSVDHNKGQKIKYWAYRTQNKNGRIVDRCLRAFYEHTATAKINQWAAKEGFTVLEFLGNDIL